MKVNIVYIARNSITKEEYVGRTNKLLTGGSKSRSYYHTYGSKSNKDNTKFHNAIRKYGPENFKWDILKTCQSWEEAGIMETFMIMVHHTHWTEGGYNLTWGNDGGSGCKASAETRKRMSEAHKGKHSGPKSEEHKQKLRLLAQNRTEEHKQKLRLAAQNRTEEHKQKLRDNHHDVKGKNNPMYGRKHTEETLMKLRGPKSEEHKKKLSEAAKSRKISEETRRKISEANTGRKHTEEAKKKMSLQKMKNRI